jgi:hypothetical protein
MSELKEKKKLRSLVSDVPNKAEYQPVHLQSKEVLEVEQLQQQIEEARKGKAKVDSQYVGFELDERGHLFNYKLPYAEFLSSMSHIIAEGKRRRAERPDNMYKENIHMTNSPTTEKKNFG